MGVATCHVAIGKQKSWSSFDDVVPFCWMKWVSPGRFLEHWISPKGNKRIKIVEEKQTCRSPFSNNISATGKYSMRRRDKETLQPRILGVGCMRTWRGEIFFTTQVSACGFSDAFHTGSGQWVEVAGTCESMAPSVPHSLFVESVVHLYDVDNWMKIERLVIELFRERMFNISYFHFFIVNILYWIIIKIT